MSKRERYVMICMSCLLCSGAAPGQSAAYRRCLATASPSGKPACNQAELGRQDRRLDAAYRKLRLQLRKDPQQQADVRNDEREWLQHRDFSCSGADGDEHLACMVRQTAAKADSLEARLR